MLMKNILKLILLGLIFFGLNSYANSAQCFLDHAKTQDWSWKHHINRETSYPLILYLAYAYKPLSDLPSIPDYVATQIVNSYKQCGCTVVNRVFDANISGTCSTVT